MHMEMEAHQMAELHIQSILAFHGIAIWHMFKTTILIVQVSQMAMLGPLKMVAQMPMAAPHNMTVNWMLTWEMLKMACC